MFSRQLGTMGPRSMSALGRDQPVEFVRLAVFPFGSSKIGKMVKTVSDIGVVESLHLLPDSQGALHKGPGRLVATLRKVEFPQVVEAGCDIVMGRPQRAFENFASAQVEWLGLLVFALKIIEHG